MTLSISAQNHNFPTPNQVNEVNNNKSPVSALSVKSPLEESTTIGNAAQSTQSDLPRFKTNSPLLSSIVDHNITKRSSSSEEKRYCIYGHKSLLINIKKHFQEYAAGANDRYVNFNELKEAAGERPTTRTFSPEATEFAKILLSRPRLLDQLDIGINAFGRPGIQDQRFDHENLDYLIRGYRRSVNFCENHD